MHGGLMGALCCDALAHAIHPWLVGRLRPSAINNNEPKVHSQTVFQGE